MRDNREVETESEGDSDDMPPLEDISDNDGVEYPVEGESLVARRTLNAQTKVDENDHKVRRYFTLDAMLTTRYVV